MSFETWWRDFWKAAEPKAPKAPRALEYLLPEPVVAVEPKAEEPKAVEPKAEEPKAEELTGPPVKLGKDASWLTKRAQRSHRHLPRA